MTNAQHFHEDYGNRNLPVGKFEKMLKMKKISNCWCIYFINKQKIVELILLPYNIINIIIKNFLLSQFFSLCRK